MIILGWLVNAVATQAINHFLLSVQEAKYLESKA